MKKKLLALLTAGMLLASGTGVHANVYSERQQRIADALYHVELFRGTNLGYELGRELNRVEGITLLVRMLGQEEAAMSKTYTLPFTDVADWAKPYVGYAYENGITNGVSATEFGSTTTMTDYMFITLTLRALGYTDKGDAPQFVWNAPYVLADEVGLIETAMADTFFSRGDAVEVFWNALSRNDYEMAKNLQRAGVFSEDELEDAIDIYLYGKETLNNSSEGVDKLEKEDDDTEDSDNSYEFDWDKWEDWLNNDLPFISDEEDTKPSSGGNTSDNKDNNTSDKSETPDNTTDTPTDNDKENNKDNTDNETPKVPYEPTEVTYKDYLDMNAMEQQAFIMTFENPADFFTWFNNGKAAYEAANPSIEIGGDGSIDLGDLIGGNGG